MPAEKDLPIWDQGRIIESDDLNALGIALRELQRRFASNCPESVGQSYDAPALDYFPAIVQANGGSPGAPDPADGKRCYLKAAKPKESLERGDVFDMTPETFPGIYPADPFKATNLANLPNGGAMPPTDTPVICFHFWTRGVDGANSVDLYVFWWGGADNGVTVKISSSASGGGKYNGRVWVSPTSDISASGNLASTDLGTDPGADNALILNMPEIGLATHDLKNAGNTAQFYFNGRIIRTNSDGTYVVAINGFYFEDCS